MASSEKHRLEEAQRARRKELEKVKGEHKPYYFEPVIIPETGERIHIFNGKYWEDRKNKNWDHLTRVFD